MTFPGLQRFVLTDVRPTGKQLGAGSYGSVEELEVNGLVCAGKRLHDALLDRENAGVANIERRYLEECQVMAELRHPHIVQFLGLCFLEGSALPVLVMERLDSSLDELLEGVPGFPLALKRSLLADVARGLLYLHTHNPPVVHRDLSARNVLLTSSQVAKISDLGNARIVNLQPGQLTRTLTRLPGTISYMPPEAFTDGSQYGPRLDIFSFGHLTLFTLTQVFPEPLLHHTYSDPHNPDHLIPRSEVERRRDYIQQLHGQLGEEHPLVQLVHQCLHNTPARRPSAEELLLQLEAVRAQIEGPYGQSIKVNLDLEKVRLLREKDAEIEHLQQQVQQLQEEMEAKNTQLQQKDNQVWQKDHQLQEKDQQLLQKDIQLQDKDRQLHEKDCQLQEKDRQLQEKDHQLQEKDEQLLQSDQSTAGENLPAVRAQFQQLQRDMDAKIAEFGDQLLERSFEINRLWRMLKYETVSGDERVAMMRSPPPESQVQSLSGQLSSLPLNWRRCRDMLYPTSVSHAIILQRKVYIGGGWTFEDSDDCTVQVYDMEKEEWSRLPRYRYKWFGMTVINSCLTVVGGWDRSLAKVTDQLAVFDPASQNWMCPHPPMPTPRHRPAVSAYDKWLLVAGGYDGGRILATVELLNTSTNQWLTASPLPTLCRNLTSTVDRDNSVWYLAAYTKPVFCVSLPEIIQQTVSPSTTGEAPSPWHRLPDTPLAFSAVTTLRGSLLTLGGNDSGTSSTAIYLYQPENRRWDRLGDLPAAREYCSCIPLPSGELLVAGGGEGYDQYSSRVDVATL